MTKLSLRAGRSSAPATLFSLALLGSAAAALGLPFHSECRRSQNRDAE